MMAPWQYTPADDGDDDGGVWAPAMRPWVEAVVMAAVGLACVAVAYGLSRVL